jgi:protein-tyrosine phosphatase
MTFTHQDGANAIDWQDISDHEENWLRFVATVGFYHIETWETAQSGVFAVMITISDPDGALVAEHHGLAHATVNEWVAARLREDRRRRAQRLSKAQARGMARSFDSLLARTGERSFWLEQDAVRCGAYPGDYDTNVARARLTELLDLGITCLVDLTENGELEPYWPILLDLAKARQIAVQYVRHAIIDVSVPTVRELRAILDTVDYARASGQVVYIHCRGGVGRTGTVAGAWLVRHGMTPHQALARVNTARTPMYNGYKRSPETKRQEAMVLDWRKGE